MSFLSRFMTSIAASGLDTAITTIEAKAAAWSTAEVEDKLDENTRILAREMSQAAQRRQDIPAEVIAAALTAGYCAAELRHRQQHRA